MLVIPTMVAAVLIWACCLFFYIRGLKRENIRQREGNLVAKLHVARWSDSHVETLLQDSPCSPVLLHQYVANAANRNALSEALRRVEIFSVRAPHSPRCLIARVDVLQRMGREEEASALLRNAVRRLPRSVEIQLLWAREAVRRKDRAEALDRFGRLRLRFPESAESYLEAADVLIHDGHRVDAEAMISTGMRQLGDCSALWRSAAMIAGNAGDLQEAIRRWDEMRARFPFEPAGYLGGATALAQVGRDEEAALLIRQARDFFPANKEIVQAAERLTPPKVS